MVSIDSWEYSIDFIVLQTKSKLNGYPLILGRLWLAIIDAYISCRVGNMAITNGKFQKKLVPYPHSKLQIQEEIPMCVGKEEEEAKKLCTYVYSLLTIEIALAIKKTQTKTRSSPILYKIYIQLL